MGDFLYAISLWLLWVTVTLIVMYVVRFIFSIRKRISIKRAFDSLAMLFHLIIGCDGVISDEEINVANRYFDQAYKKFRLGPFMGYFNNSNRMENRMEKALNATRLKSYRSYCLIILRTKVDYQTRYEMLSVLFEVAFVHEGIIYTEVQLLRNIAHFLLIKKDDLFALEEKYGVTKKEEKKRSQTDYLYNLYIHTLSQSYRTLELEPSVKKEEIKQAYRRLAMKYHPDRLPLDATEEARAQAASQFRLVNEAYNYLRKERKIV